MQLDSLISRRVERRVVCLTPYFPTNYCWGIIHIHALPRPCGSARGGVPSGRDFRTE